jgi:hypothetical protein
MSDRKRAGNNASTEQTREERLKAALKANLARRKAQSRRRAQGEAVEDSGKVQIKRDGD